MYPMLTEQSLDCLLSLGFDLFEIFFNSFSELEDDYLDRLRYKLECAGARVASLHPFTSSFESFLLFSDYERRFLDGIGFYERYFRTAQRLGARMVVLHGLNTTYRSSLSNQEYFRRFSVLQERADRYGVELLQENVANFRSRDPEFLASMRESIPQSAAFVCDIKQALRSGCDPLEILRSMGSKLRHVHISGSTPELQCVLPGCGNYDLAPLFDYLLHSGYSGDIIIEVYRFSFGQPAELQQARRFLQPYLDKFNNDRRNHT